MVDAMEKMDTIQGILDQLNRALADAKALRSEYARYNRYMLGKKGLAYQGARKATARSIPLSLHPADPAVTLSDVIPAQGNPSLHPFLPGLLILQVQTGLVKLGVHLLQLCIQKALQFRCSHSLPILQSLLGLLFRPLLLQQTLLLYLLPVHFRSSMNSLSSCW